MKLRVLILFFWLASPSAFAQGACSIRDKGPLFTLLRCSKISVLYLHGNPLERAKTLGSLLKGPLSPDVVNYYSLKIFEKENDHPLFRLIYNQWIRLLHRNTPKNLTEEVDAMAEGMGVDSIFLKRAISLPDTASAINALGNGSLFRGIPAAGCTSIALKDSVNFIYGRNLDFAGAELWDKHPIITAIIPPAGSEELKHYVFGADGALFGGITGVNEAGISFAVQQNYSLDAGISGIPMMFLGELVLRSARNLKDAEEILRRYRPSMLWTFVVTDLKTGEAMAVESSAHSFFRRGMEKNGLVQTNHITNPKSTDEFISPGTKMNSIYRMKKAFETLEAAKKGEATVKAVADLLAYQEDPRGELLAHKDVLKAHTIQSVILTGKSGAPDKVYLSQDEAPTAGGTYLAFSFSDLVAARVDLPFEIQDLAQVGLEKRKHQREISQAFHAYFDEKNIPLAASLLSGHQTVSASLFQAVARYELGEFQESLRLADRALQEPRFRGEAEHIMQSLGWVKLASLVQLKRHEEAVEQAKRLLAKGLKNERLRTFSQQILANTAPSNRFLRLHFEFFSGDLSGRAR